MFIGEVAADQVAAIVIEPVQGEGGFMIAPPGFLRDLKRYVSNMGFCLLPMRSRLASAAPARCLPLNMMV